MVTIFRGDTSKINVKLKPTSDITDFNGYTVILVLKEKLDRDITDSKAVYKNKIAITTPETTEVEFDLSHFDTLIPDNTYYGNIRLVKNTNQEVVSSENFQITFTLGATQGVE